MLCWNRSLEKHVISKHFYLCDEHKINHGFNSIYNYFLNGIKIQCKHTRKLNLKLFKCVDIKKLQAKGQIKSFKDLNTILCTNIICEFSFVCSKEKKSKHHYQLPMHIALKYYNDCKSPTIVWGHDN